MWRFQQLAGQHHRLSWFEAPAAPRGSSWREHVLANPVEAVVHSLAAADFDRDGRMDIAFAEMHQGADPDEVGLYLNRGAERPWQKVVLSTAGSHGLQPLDADGDGAPDLFEWGRVRRSRLDETVRSTAPPARTESVCAHHALSGP
jgi:hypothetical protein